MKKSVSAFMILLISFSILPVFLQNGNAEPIDLLRRHEKHFTIEFPEPEIRVMGEYCGIEMPNCSYVSIAGHPKIPVRTIVVKVPIDSLVESVEVETIERQPIEMPKAVLPVPRPVPLGLDGYFDPEAESLEPDPTIYGATEPYPTEWLSYAIKRGIDPEANARVQYIIVSFWPARYLPRAQELRLLKEASVTIVYEDKAESRLVGSQLMNLIITPTLFESEAMRLAEFKNSTGISSRVVTLYWVYSNYPGIDHQAQIRNCIGDFVTEYGAQYVTLFGDADQVPVRYVYVPDVEVGETYIPTDLYYADLDGTWDDNEDGLYGDQENDMVDGIPDVYVGRIPPSLTEYASVAVNKTIEYSLNFGSENEWADRIVLAAGTGNGLGSAPTVLNEYIADMVSNETLVKLYQSFGNLSTASMASEINKGCLFLNFAGHGDPGAGLFSVGWLFYWVIQGLIWNGFGIVDVQKLTNGYKLPVVTTMSCSTARFDDDTDCIGESFVLEPDGGAIAYFGATRVAWGYVDEGAPDGLMGEMDWRVYEAFYEGNTRLGSMWGETIKKYVQNHVWNYHYAGALDVKTFMEFVLLGDPTLRIGNPDRPAPKLPSDMPVVFVDQQNITTSPGETITIGVRIFNLSENFYTTKEVWEKGEPLPPFEPVDWRYNYSLGYLYAFDLRLGWDPTILEYVNHTAMVPVDDHPGGILHGPSVIMAADTVNETAGTYKLLVSSQAPAEAFNLPDNNATAFTITFNVIGPGKCDINFTNVELAVDLVGLGFPFSVPAEIPHWTLNGVVTSTCVAIVKVIPENTVLGPENVLNHEFTIACVVENVENLTGLDVQLSWNTTYLTYVNHTFTVPVESFPDPIWPSLYHGVIHTPFTILKNEANSTAGTCWFATSTLSGNGFNGNGTIFVMTFRVENQPLVGEDAVLALHFNNVDLSDLYASEIPHETHDGTVIIRKVYRNLRIIDGQLSKTIAGQGHPVSINVSVANDGGCAETFNVSLFANNTLFQSTNLTLESEQSITINFMWNTSASAKGNHTIVIYVWPVQDEADTADNALAIEPVFLTLPGDVDGDRDVDIFDIVRMAYLYGVETPDPRYEPNRDIDGDGDIDIFDIVIAASHYGDSW